MEAAGRVTDGSLGVGAAIIGAGSSEDTEGMGGAVA